MLLMGHEILAKKELVRNTKDALYTRHGLLDLPSNRRKNTPGPGCKSKNRA